MTGTWHFEVAIFAVVIDATLENAEELKPEAQAKPSSCITASLALQASTAGLSANVFSKLRNFKGSGHGVTGLLCGFAALGYWPLSRIVASAWLSENRALTAWLRFTLNDLLDVEIAFGVMATRIVLVVSPATEGTDYQATRGSITFNPGETTKTITVVTNGDLLHEANEVFFVNLTNSMQAAILDGQGRGTIRNNDLAPRLSIGDVTVIEGATAVFTVNLSASSGQAITVNFATANGTAIAGREYVATTGTLTFAAGETTRTIRVAIPPNAISTSSKSFKVNLSHAVNALFSDSQALATILDSSH